MRQENSQQKEIPERVERKAAALLRISHAVMDSRALEDLCRTIQKSVEDCLDAVGFYIALYRNGQEHLVYHSPSFTGSGNPESATPNWLRAPLTIRGISAGVMAVKLKPGLPGVADGADPRRDGAWFNAAGRYLSLALEREQEAACILETEGEAILRSLPRGLALVEARTFKWVNREMVRMFGFDSPSDFLGQSVEMIYGAAEEFEFAGKTIFQELSAKGKADYELDLVRRDGSRFPVHVQLNSPGEGRLDAPTIMAAFTDMSRHREAEKEKITEERLQGALEMAGGVCHELNQPLQAILGYSELMSTDPEFRVWEAGMETIRAQAGRLGRVTARLANITQYKIIEGPENKRVVDIWGAGPPEMD